MEPLSYIIENYSVFTKNTLRLDKPFTIITGPNASGKSMLLRGLYATVKIHNIMNENSDNKKQYIASILSNKPASSEKDLLLLKNRPSAPFRLMLECGENSAEISYEDKLVIKGGCPGYEAIYIASQRIQAYALANITRFIENAAMLLGIITFFFGASGSTSSESSIYTSGYGGKGFIRMARLYRDTLSFLEGLPATKRLIEAINLLALPTLYDTANAILEHLRKGTQNIPCLDKVFPGILVSKKHLGIEIGEHGSVPINLVSSGIEHVLPITLTLSRIEPSTDNIVIIEEPELNLEYNRQRILSECLVEYIYKLLHENHRIRIIITTHSDIFLYSFTEKVAEHEYNDIRVYEIINNNIIEKKVNEYGEVDIEYMSKAFRKAFFDIDV